MRFFICLGAILLSLYPAFAHAARSEIKVWGTNFSVESPEQNRVDQKVAQFRALVQTWQSAMDPDCYYGQKTCTKRKAPIPGELTDLVKTLAAETLGFFNIHTDPRDDKSPRDFGGISQGFLLEKLKDPAQEMILDFGKDFFVSGTHPKTLTWGDPVLQILPLATITLKSGWMLGSAQRATGAKMRNPHAKRKWQENFDAILLLARPGFSGGILDGWSTALIPGGKKLLTHLLSLKHYQGQWSYAYLERETQKFVCSPDLICEKGKGKSVYAIQTPY